MLPKSVLLLLSGCGAGFLLVLALFNPGLRAQAAGAMGGPFVDVPANHIAAADVADLKAKGIVTGFADNTYRGSQPITRYELAVILARFARYYDHSKEPLSKKSAAIPASPSWADPSRQYLASNEFVPATSPLFSAPGTRLVSADEFAGALSSIMDRLNDRSLPPTTND